MHIQRRRTKGWHLPPNAMIVDRTTPWGNPFEIGKHGDRTQCVLHHKYLLCGLICLTCGVSVDDQLAYQRYVFEHVGELVGKRPCCWCREDQACHGDTLADFAATYEAVMLWPPGEYYLTWETGNLAPLVHVDDGRIERARVA